MKNVDLYTIIVLLIFNTYLLWFIGNVTPKQWRDIKFYSRVGFVVSLVATVAIIIHRIAG